MYMITGVFSFVGDVLLILAQIIFRCKIYNIGESFTKSTDVLEWITERNLASPHYMVSDDHLVPTGLTIGKWFIALIKPGETKGRNKKFTCSIFLICWNVPKDIEYSKYDKNGKKKVDHAMKKGKEDQYCEISTIEKVSVWKGCGFDTNKKSFFRQAYKYQLDIAKKIIELAKARKKVNGSYGGTILINGPPGTGKTYIGKILAALLEASICPSFSPTREGDWFLNAYYTADPSKKEPFVLIMDEIDISAKKIMDGTIKRSKEVNMVDDKQSWNNLFDRFPEYNNTFIIMTSNRSIGDFEGHGDLDQSLFRPGRADAYFSVGYAEKSDLPNHFTYGKEVVDEKEFIKF